MSTEAWYVTNSVATARETLRDLFGAEYNSLNYLLREVITEDFRCSTSMDQRDYRLNIGGGNLAAYAEAMVSEFAWRQVRAIRGAS